MLNLLLCITSTDDVLDRSIANQDIVNEEMNCDVVLWENVANTSVWKCSELTIDTITFKRRFRWII